MKTLTVLTVTTLLVSSVFCANTSADELSTELHATVTQHLAGQKAATTEQAYSAMLQTVIDVKARLQAEQDATTLLAMRDTAAKQAE